MKKKIYIIPDSQTAEITTLYRLCGTSAGGNTETVDKEDDYGSSVF